VYVLTKHVIDKEKSETERNRLLAGGMASGCLMMGSGMGMMMGSGDMMKRTITRTGRMDVLACQSATRSPDSPCRHWRHQSADGTPRPPRRHPALSVGVASSSTWNAPSKKKKVVVPVTLQLIFLLLYAIYALVKQRSVRDEHRSNDQR